MQAEELAVKIKQLPLSKRFYVIEETLKSIKEEVLNHRMSSAVEELYDEYKTNRELTSFTSLDYDQFYETK